MFSCISNVYLFGFSDDVYKAVTRIKPDFINLFSMDKMDEAWIKDSDFIVARVSATEVSDLAYKIKQCNKSVKNLIISMNAEEFEAIHDDVGGLWPENMTIKQIEYFFNGLFSFIEIKNDYEDKLEILKTIMNSTTDLIWVKDTCGRHKMFNNSFLAALPPASDGHKKTRAECIDKEHLFLWELDLKEYQADKYICMESEFGVINAGETLVLEETLLVGDGELRNLVTTKSPLHDRKGNIVGTVGFAKDVTAELQYKTMLEKQAFIDDLTNLYNRRYIYDYADSIKDKEFLLIYIDLDRFKFINDKYGHVVGDNALILTAEILNRCFDDAVIGRIGGDEFAVICEKWNESLKSTIQALPSKAKEIYNSNPKFKNLGLSVGYAVNDKDNHNLEKLFVLADKRMYENKKINKKHK